MATAAEQKNFLDKTVPSWQKYGSEYKFKIISFGIAQACLESGWGFSSAAKNKNNLLGIGPGMTFSSWDECIKAYFTKTVLGQSSKAKNATTLDEYYDAFVASGYLGGSGQQEYYNNVKSIINTHNLTQYDNGGSGSYGSKLNTVYPDIDDSANGTRWTESYPNREICWIVIHYTGGSTTDTPIGTCQYWSQAERKGSADYVVGRDGTVARYNKDIKNRFTYNCGKYGDSTKTCTNQHSIGIENCNAPGEGPFTDAQKKTLRQLVQAIMSEFNIAADHVVRHCDVSDTDCPQPYNNQSKEHEAAWKELHTYLTTGYVGGSGSGSTWHSYTREDALIMEFGYWNTKSLKPQKDKTQYTASAVNMGELIEDIAEVFGLSLGGSGGSGTTVAGEAKAKSGKILTSGTYKEMPSGVEQTGIIANFTQYDRSWSKDCTQYTLYKEWVDQGKPSNHFVATISGYYLIAPGRYFSNSAGDILEVKLEDDTSFYAIVGDTKNPKDCPSEYGHYQGKSNKVDVIEWETASVVSGNTVSSDQDKLKKGLNDWGIMGKKVKGMVNYGTYFQ